MDSVADHSEPVKIKVRATPDDYKAGEALAESGNVRLMLVNPIKVTATVSEPGTDKAHHAELASTPSGLAWKCSCTVDPKLFCKHLVATALVASQKAPKRRT